MRLFILLIMSFLILTIPTKAQLQKMYFSHLSKNNGLPSNNVLSIFQDRHGFLWFGTFEGLGRYDGYSIQRFIFSGKNKLSDNQIYSMTEDKNGKMWIGTSKGLNCIDGNTFALDTAWKKKSSILSTKIVMSVFYDSQKQLWAGTAIGLYKYNSDNQSFTLLKEFQDIYIKSISEDAQHNLLVGTKKGLFVLSPQHKVLARYLENCDISSILVDSKGHLWLTSYEGKSVFYSENTKNIQLEVQKNLSNNKAIKIIEDKEQNYWLLFRDEGLWLKQANTPQWINLKQDRFNPNGMSSNVPQTAFCDVHGNVWIGYFDAGIDLYDKHRKPFYQIKDNFSPNGLLNNRVRAIYQDSDGEIWVGTKNDGTLAKFNPIDFTFKHYRNEPNNPHSINDDHIYCITEAKKGFLWVGTHKGGLNLFEKKTGKCTFYKNNPDDKNSLCSNTIGVIFCNDDGKIWIGTSKNLDVLDTTTNTFKHYTVSTAPNSLTAVGIKIIYKDHQGTIWIATTNGLNRYNPKTDDFKRFLFDPKNPYTVSNGIFAIYEDSQHNFWIGTKNGLHLMNRKQETFTTFTEKDGLPSDVVVGIYDDHQGSIWFSTTNGLSKYNLSTKKFKNYSTEDGLQSNEFTAFSHCQTKDGALFFGGNDGFTMFYPNQIQDNTIIPRVVFTGFSIFNAPVVVGENAALLKDITHASTITLNANQTVITFEFAALNFTSPEKNLYAYKMEGFETKWNYVGTKRSATYTNLDAGEYIFTVKASNNDNIWNETGTSIKLIILPPWWKTWWFRILMGSLIVSSIVMLYRIRVNRLHRQKRVLEEKVRDRTCELQESNILLEERHEEILQQHEKIVSQKVEIEKSYNNSRLLSDLGQKITSQLNLKAINGMIYTYIQSLIGTSAFGIGIYNAQQQEIVFDSFTENGNQIPSFTKSIDDPNSLTAWAIRNRTSLFINDLERDFIQYVPQLNPHKASKSPQSLMHIPLIAEDRIIGVIVLNNFEKNTYTYKDLDTLHTLASYICIALDNSNAYTIVKKQHEKITSSINYAQTIQQAILPNLDDLQHFLIYKPKDIVSGDFYWYNKIEELNTYFIAVVDCTGHGVPGAFMSLIGNLILNEIVLQREIYSPAEILTEIDKTLKNVLNQSVTKNDDGMDICLCSVQYVDSETINVIYASAKRRLFYFDSFENTIKTIKGDLKGIGGSMYKSLSFKNYPLNLHKGDILYLTSDGYTDQNDKNRRELGKDKFIELLNEIATLPITEQQLVLEIELSKHQGNQLQRDDITVLGLKL